MQNDKSISVADLNISEQEKFETLYLWRDVVRSTAESRCTILSEHVLLAHPEVSDLYVSLLIQHHIV